MIPDLVLTMQGLPDTLNDTGAAMERWSDRASDSMAGFASRGNESVRTMIQGMWDGGTSVDSFGTRIDDVFGSKARGY